MLVDTKCINKLTININNWAFLCVLYNCIYLNKNDHHSQERRNNISKIGQFQNTLQYMYVRFRIMYVYV